MKIVFCLLAAIFAGQANAMIINGFTGSYHATNWNTTIWSTPSGNGQLTIDNNEQDYVQFGIANQAIAYPIDAYIDYETVAAATGVVSFDMIMGILFRPVYTSSPYMTFYSYVKNDFNIEETFGIDGAIEKHIDIAVTAGQTFGVRFFAQNIQQDVSLDSTISNFSAPIPEPDTLLLTALGVLILLRFYRRHNNPGLTPSRQV